ncbi:Spt20-like, SEP domain [Dillenia turbinata]|uniref:Spt20-like, SEP domain n=1 Tax=Dillenia turbinata TaxID=194707 RepID=A0AAN8UYQ2_9MAGN
MGVSFKVAKIGRRYRPKPLQSEDNEVDNGTVNEPPMEGNHGAGQNNTGKRSHALAIYGSNPVIEDLKATITINLYPSGFSIGYGTELFKDEAKGLHPYDRSSETLFSAIEYGCLPGDLFDDLPCNYVNGAVICEIRDFRSVLQQKGSMPSVANISPIVHRVQLRMSMENVIKDVSSIADDSWTYRDILEVESRILKALQPNLQLDPKPLQTEFSGRLMTRKLNLEIPGSRKRRKGNDLPVANLGLNNPGERIKGSIVVAKENSMPPNLTLESRKVSHPQQSTSSSFLDSRENKLPEPIIESAPLSSRPDFLLAGSCNMSALKTIAPKDCISKSKQWTSNCYSDPRKSCASSPDVANVCKRLPVQGRQVKKPKQEPLDSLHQQALGSHAEGVSASELQQKRLAEENRPSHTTVHSRQKILEGTLKQPAGFFMHNVKRETVETNNFLTLGMGKFGENCHAMDERRNPSTLQQSQLQQVLPILRGNSNHNSMQLNHLGQQPTMMRNQASQLVEKNMANETIKHKKKSLPAPPPLAGAGTASAKSHFNDALLRKSNSCPKEGSSMDSAMCLTGSNDTACIIANTPGGASLSQPTEIQGNSGLKGILAIVNKRYGLNNKKHKDDQAIFGRKQFPRTNQLLEIHLHNSETSTNAEDAPTVNRMLTFVRPLCSYQDTPIGAENKLVVEKHDDDMVRACVLYGNIEGNDFVCPLPPSFTGTHLTGVCTDQFISLMRQEGYQLVDDPKKSIYRDANGASSSWQTCPRVGAGAGPIKLPPPTLISGPSLPTLGPMSNKMLPLNLSQSPSQDILSRGSMHVPRKLHSASQFSPGFLTKSQLELAAQVVAMQPDSQQFVNHNAHHQFQLQQNVWQFMQRKMMEGMFSTSDDIYRMQLGNGIQGLGHVGLGSFGSVLGMAGASPMSSGRNFLGNPIMSSDNSGNMPGFDNYHRLLGGISDANSVLAMLMREECQGRASIGGASNQMNAIDLPANQPKVTSIAMNSTNQQLHIRRQLLMLQQQQQQASMISSLQNLEGGAISANHVGLPLSQVSSQASLQLNMSSQQSGAGSVLQRSSSAVLDPSSPELSARTHGSMGSNNTASSGWGKRK